MEIKRRLKRDRDICRKAVLSDVKTAFTCTPALNAANAFDVQHLLHVIRKSQGTGSIYC